ncbi:hypothetical protein [Brevundimonas bacteroides]|uniref:hypothetical protein n=1 Tax=Brevundimonas bacteroides TaxID=74311 RepID=UPI0012EE148F|nr:hypothetical protein [Brevundimonas bacteroides]
MKTKNPPQEPPAWAVAPFLEQGDESPSIIYHAVGQALSRWEVMDDQVATLFEALIASRKRAGFMAFGTVVANSARLEMVKAAALVVLRGETGGPLYAEVEKTLDEIGKMVGRRNEIAHGVVTGFSRTDGGETQHQGYFLIPAMYATRKNQIPKSYRFEDPAWAMTGYAYTGAQIDAYASHFNNYLWRLIDLCGRIGTHLASEGG